MQIRCLDPGSSVVVRFGAFPGLDGRLLDSTTEASPTIFERDDLPRSKGVCEMVIFQGFVVLRSIVMSLAILLVTFLWMVICDPFKGCL